MVLMQIQLSQQLKQVMTTDTIFHLELLALTNDELATMIADKILENPLLQVDDNFDVKRNSTYTKRINDMTSFEDKQSGDDIANHLLELMPLHQLTTQVERAIIYLIHNLDERLFLTVDAIDVAKKFNMRIEEVEDCINLLQSFEPFGIGTKNTQHFLMFQVKNDVVAPPFAYAFIEHELAAVASLEVPLLMKKYKLSKQQVLDTIAYIKTLKPYPLYPTVREQTFYLIPDMEIVKVANEWIIEMNEQLLPRLSLNEQYVALLKEEQHLKQYAERQLKEAMLLLEGIEQRKKTLYKIVDWLITKQYAFFEEGIDQMRPLRLIDAANDLQLHESTISRAIRGKCVKTPFGTLFLKQFFPRGMIQKRIKVTTDHIKQRIQQLIASECITEPLSDQQLVEHLMMEHIHISRRTVAKYRESLFIPNSMKRAYLR